MFLFRRRMGAGNQTQTNVENTPPLPPPSYEDSQDASLREVLQEAKTILPLLWPSTSDTSPSPSSSSTPSPSLLGPSYSFSSPTKNEDTTTPGTKPSIEKKDYWDTQHPNASNPEETARIHVLANLALVPCDGRPFLDRIRQFSDLYFTPYIGKEAYARDEPVSNAERARTILRNMNASRESAALVLCARVLEEYYATLGHVDTIVESSSLSKCNGGSSSSSSNSSTSSGSSTTNTTTKGCEAHPRGSHSSGVKTRLTQITPCTAQDCSCGDFDEAQQHIIQEYLPSPHCVCGHPRSSHSQSLSQSHSQPPSQPSPFSSSSSPSCSSSASETSTQQQQGLSRLFRHYTNWEPSSYPSLSHRSINGSTKRHISEITACSALLGCACRDYDKYSRTALCGRCGHHHRFHVSLQETLRKQKKEEEEEDERQKKRKKKKEKKGGNGVVIGNDDDGERRKKKRAADWELSWILVENAYLLLTRLAPVT
ncbi:hypothetical protein F5Y08DRAFT_244256 [Xylaria arbuscula]|nr:hypothetical protein F5Y08DRAFT_244256 [Xylaria arbuscula]